MFILYGFISVITILFIDCLIMLLSGFSIHNFNLWFIIPAGGLIEGALCGIGIFLYLMKKNLKISAKHIISSGLIAFIAFWAITYFTYASTYIDNGKVNNIFKGEHISNYMYNDRKVFTFSNYLNYQFENAETSIQYRGRNVGSSTNLGKGINKVSFYVSSLGFLIGGLAVGLIFLGNTVYCDKCKRYMKERKLFDFTYSEWSKEVSDLQYALQGTREDFENFVRKERVMTESLEPYISVTLAYCNSCKDAFIIFKFMEVKKNSKGDLTWEENRTYNRKLDLDNKVSSTII